MKTIFANARLLWSRIFWIMRVWVLLCVPMLTALMTLSVNAQNFDGIEYKLILSVLCYYVVFAVCILLAASIVTYIEREKK